MQHPLPDLLRRRRTRLCACRSWLRRISPDKRQSPNTIDSRLDRLELLRRITTSDDYRFDLFARCRRGGGDVGAEARGWFDGLTLEKGGELGLGVFGAAADVDY